MHDFRWCTIGHMFQLAWARGRDLWCDQIADTSDDGWQVIFTEWCLKFIYKLISMRPACNTRHNIFLMPVCVHIKQLYWFRFYTVQVWAVQDNILGLKFPITETLWITLAWPFVESCGRTSEFPVWRLTTRIGYHLMETRRRYSVLTL